MDLPVLVNQLCADTGFNMEDLLGVIDDRDEWKERESGKSQASAWINDDDNDVVRKIYK